MLEFRVLGTLEASDETGPLLLGGQKQRCVLALLLLEAPRPVATDRLIDVLWGERPPRTAATSLQNFISQLRKSIGTDVLVTKPPGYALAIAQQQLDLGRFRSLVAEARDVDEPQARSDKLRAALALWRGPPLADLAFESFAEAFAAPLEEEHVATLEDRIEADLAAGRHREIVGELEQLVEQHPVRERLRAQLMLALYRSGRQAEALEVYQRARRFLLGELGIDPGRELRELHASMLRQDVRLRVPGGAQPAEDHFEEVADVLLSGRLVPVLATEATGLAERLAQRFQYTEDGAQLPRVAQYVAVMKGSGPLYDELHETFDVDTEPTIVHRFFARLPALLRERGSAHPLIVTTRYDLALESALLQAGESFEVVSYIASGASRGKFCHIDANGDGRVIDLPNEYATELSLDRTTVILRLHGRVDRTPERAWESFVVTEDDYIDYLAQTDLTASLPVSVAAKLRRSHFLFLGYTMADWNLRV
ncbi:MAG TPA: BTAD domain-containing putative transcriptional regulator, partial [Gaiellaceae bacterium]|nr:BTAD domain-containing putative transcriptional regulator [Gaiellaceae bacterium]